MSRKPRYKPADKYFSVNNNDKDLTPIYVSIPKPPPVSLIDGYGLDPKDQFFKRHEYPEKLRNLEKRLFRESVSENKNKSPKIARILNNYWKVIDENPDHYEEEIKWMEKVIYHCINGYWFFNRGKPTYIVGWHYELLNFWYNPDLASHYFEYRDRDRRKLAFDYYAYTAKETFKTLDDEGFAVKNSKDAYDMVDLGRRISYGTIKAKNRRSGETHQGLLINWAVIRKSIGGVGVIISKTGKDAKDYWDEKFLPSWRKYPMFLKPLSDGSNDPQDLNLKPTRNDFVSPSLESKFMYIDSASEKATDGKKVKVALYDEQSKQNTSGKKVDVSARFDINKLTLAQNLDIHGFATNPSTVEEMNQGGEIYYRMTENSKFYQRMPSGQTKIGLFRQYEASPVGWGGFISPWGDSIADDPSKEMIKDTLWFCNKYNVPKNSFTYLEGRGARRVLEEEREMLLKDGSPLAMKEYRRVIRKSPLCYAECWSGTDGDLGLPIEIITETMAELRRSNYKPDLGYFAWKNDVKDSEVVWISDKDKGYIEISEHPKPAIRNQKYQSYEFVPLANKRMLTSKPKFPTLYTLGVDSFGYNDELVASTGSSRSDGGLRMLKERDKVKDTDNVPIEEWDGFKFIMSCRYRLSQDDFDEQALMACVYFGSMCFLERNRDSTWKHFIKRGYRGYLKFEMEEDGKIAQKPGYYASVPKKEEGFERLAMYLEKRGHTEKHYNFLKECKDIKSLKDMTKNDELAACIAALLGSQSMYSEIIEDQSHTGLGDQISSFINGLQIQY